MISDKLQSQLKYDVRENSQNRIEFIPKPEETPTPFISEVKDVAFDKEIRDTMKLKQSEIYSKFTKIVRQQTLDYKEQAKELEKLELSKNGRKREILILINILKQQISKQYKQYGEALIKLWKGYFKEVSEEHQQVVKNKNELCICLLQELINIKNLMNEKDNKIIDLTKEVVRMTNANGHFQLVLDQQRKLYSMQKSETEKQMKQKEELEKEFEFWLPGYPYYYKDDHSRTRIKEIIPNRRKDGSSKNLEQSTLFIYGDCMRMLSSLKIKLPIQIQCEELQYKIDEMTLNLEDSRDREEFYK